MGRRPRPHRGRRADPARHPVPPVGRLRRPLGARALGRRGLPRRPRRRGDPAAGADRVRLRHLGRDDVRPPLPRRAHPRRGRAPARARRRDTSSTRRSSRRCSPSSAAATRATASRPERAPPFGYPPRVDQLVTDAAGVEEIAARAGRPGLRDRHRVLLGAHLRARAVLRADRRRRRGRADRSAGGSAARRDRRSDRRPRRRDPDARAGRRRARLRAALRNPPDADPRHPGGGGVRRADGSPASSACWATR